MNQPDPILPKSIVQLNAERDALAESLAKSDFVSDVPEIINTVSVGLRAIATPSFAPNFRAQRRQEGPRRLKHGIRFRRKENLDALPWRSCLVKLVASDFGRVIYVA